MFLNGCIEDINVKLPGSERKIVIEGRIENGKPAEVFVMRNAPLSDTANYYKYYRVTDAKITVSDGVNTETLVGPTDLFYYGDSESTYRYPPYKGKTILGIPGKTYYLTVVADGKTYTSITTIPTPIALDSVWWKKVSDQKPNIGYAWARLSEPAGLGNAYRWSAKRANKTYANGETRDRRYLSPVGATFDDKLIDGKILDFNYSRGVDPTDFYFQDHPNDFVYEYKRSDTIYVKFCTIDQNSAKFYTTYETAYASNGNPFAAPVNVITNINGGGLGIWAGFGCTYDTIMPQP